MTEAEWMASDDPAKMLPWIDGSVNSERRLKRTPTSDRKLRLFAVACCRAVWHLLTDSVPCERCDDGFVREKYQGGAAGLETRSREVHCPDCHGTGTANRSRRAVDVMEQFADGLATRDEWYAAHIDSNGVAPHNFAWNCTVPHAASAASNAVHWTGRMGVQPLNQTALLRDIVGNPFRPVISWQERVRIEEMAQQLVSIPEVAVAVESFGNTSKGNAPQHIRGEWLTPAVLAGAKCIYESRAFDELPVLADALEDAGCDNADILSHCRGPGPHVRGCWVLDVLLGKE